MIIEIEGIIALISGFFVLFSLLRFLHYFKIYKNVALHRIKLSKNVVNYFIFLLCANFILVITYSLASFNCEYALFVSKVCLNFPIIYVCSLHI